MTEGASGIGESGPDYAVPALDKAIDVLELLADTDGALTQTEIAEALGRSVNQLFRVLQTLERRGWIHRQRPSGAYALSMRMFSLAHRHPPLRGLTGLAAAPMRELAARTRQSCNLSVLDGGRVRVIAQVESPEDFGFVVRVGAGFDAESTPAGRVLLGRTSEGLVRVADATRPGITDVVVPVTDVEGAVLAAITVPYVATEFSGMGIEQVEAALRTAGERVSSRVRGTAA
jgi:DNA-binding IclR family transcriptional regulator